MANNTEQLLNLTAIENEETTVEVIVRYNGDIRKLEAEIGIEVEILEFNYAIITLKPEQVEELYNHTEIEYIELPKIVTFNIEQERSNICLPTPTNSSYDLKGRGTIIAVIDSGIDYTHPDFRKEDRTSKILYIWDQSGTGTPPDGFKSGTEYTKEEINIALKNNNPLSVIPQMDTNRTWDGSSRSSKSVLLQRQTLLQ